MTHQAEQIENTKLIGCWKFSWLYKICIVPTVDSNQKSGDHQLVGSWNPIIIQRVL